MNAGAQRGRVDAALVDAVRRVDGVAAAEGGVVGYARLIGKDGEGARQPGQRRARRSGSPGPTTAALNPLVDRRRARAPRRPTRSSSTAQSAEKSATRRRRHHDRAGAGGPPQRVASSASIAFGSRRQPRRRDHGGRSTAAVAQRLLGEPGQVGRDLRRRRRRRVAASRSPNGWHGVLPPGVEAVTGADRHRGEPGPVRPRRDVVLHLPSCCLRRRRAAGRRVHDLQHLLHHRRAADQGERPAARAGRQPAAGARRRC